MRVSSATRASLLLSWSSLPVSPSLMFRLRRTVAGRCDLPVTRLRTRTPHGSHATARACPAPAERCRALACGTPARQARPAVFWVLRETESMTTAASSTAPVIMYWIGVAMPCRARPVLDRDDDQDAEQRVPGPAASAEEAGAADDGRRDDVHQQVAGAGALVGRRDLGGPGTDRRTRRRCPRSRRPRSGPPSTLMPARRAASTLPPSAKILRPYVVRRSTKSVTTSTTRKITRASGRPLYWLSMTRAAKATTREHAPCAPRSRSSGRDGMPAASRRLAVEERRDGRSRPPRPRRGRRRRRRPRSSSGQLADDAVAVEVDGAVGRRASGA